MHELSVVMSIIDLAESKASEHGATSIDSIQLEIGQLAGIDREALDFAWGFATKNTRLQHAECSILEIPGEARCIDCGAAFQVQTLFEPCPVCGQYLTEITGGKELKVKSLTVT